MLSEIHNMRPAPLKPCEVCSVWLGEAGGLVLSENMVHVQAHLQHACQ